MVSLYVCVCVCVCVCVWHLRIPVSTMNSYYDAKHYDYKHHTALQMQRRQHVTVRLFQFLNYTRTHIFAHSLGKLYGPDIHAHTHANAPACSYFVIAPRLFRKIPSI